jgi:hypothetical protein
MQAAGTGQAGDVSGSTPDDLAVAFQSLARRRREAIGDSAPAALGGLPAELQRHIDAAAATLGTTGDAAAVAAAIRARRPEDWDGATLDELRRHALDAGDVLRRIAAAAGTDADD